MRTRALWLIVLTGCGGATATAPESAPLGVVGAEDVTGWAIDMETGRPLTEAQLARLQAKEAKAASKAHATATAVQTPAQATAKRTEFALRPVDTNGMPDVHVELGAEPSKPRALCSIAGTGRPFVPNDCQPLTPFAVSLDDAGSAPFATVRPAGVQVRFDVSDGTRIAWTEVSDDRFSVRGFVDLSNEPFQLKREAVGLEGHMKLLVGARADLQSVDSKGLVVRSRDDVANIEDFDARAWCDAFAYNPAQDTATMGATVRGDALPTGDTLHLKLTAGGAVAATLRLSETISVEIVEQRVSEARVRFSTKHALFDGWVDAPEIQPNPAGVAFGIAGLGACGVSSCGGGTQTMELGEDTDVLVASAPGIPGTARVRALKGAHVIAREGHGGWAEIEPFDSKIAPAGKQKWWVPWRVLWEMRAE